MEINVILDRCNAEKEIREVFVEIFSELLLEMGIDYYNDFDHTDAGTFVDSMRAFKIHVEVFPDINGYRVYMEDDIILEIVESSRSIIYDDGYFFSVFLETYTILDEQIDLGE